MAIHLTDVDWTSRDDLRRRAPDEYWAAGRELVVAFNREGEEVAGVVGWAALRAGIASLNERLGGHFREEAAQLASRIGVSEADILTANLAYDLGQIGCSTFVQPTADGPLHARNLDWSFPGALLRKHLFVERVHGAPAGRYAMVTWPALFGALTGLAPGRFSVTVNYVLHRGESRRFALAARAVAGFWPSTWVVRQALDQQLDFAAAVEFLSSVPVLSPVLFTVAGVRDDERVVIERSASTSAVRSATGDAAVFVTNHYSSPELQECNVELDGDADTLRRFAALEHGLARGVHSADAALELLATGVLLNATETQHQVAMSARAGTMVVRVPGGPRVEVSV